MYKADTITGTITLTSGQREFTTSGVGLIVRGHMPGDQIFHNGLTLTIEEITGENSGVLLDPCPAGAAGVDVPVRIRFQPDGSRVKAESRNLIETLGNGNIEALAELSGMPQLIPIFTGPGAMSLVPRSELVSSLKFDARVDTLAERAAYDDRSGPSGTTLGFRIVVDDTGNGRAAMYEKLSDTSADWSDPLYLSGPALTLDIGDVTEVAFGSLPDVTLDPATGGHTINFDLPAAPTLGVGTVTTGAPGTSVIVTADPVVGGYELNFTIPKGDTGDIDGITAFWQGLITTNADAAAARAGMGVVARDGSTVMTGDLQMDGNKVTGMADGTNPGDAVNKSQLDAVEQGLDDDKLNKDGSNVGDAGAKAAFLANITGLTLAEGDLLYVDGDGNLANLGKGTAGQVLRQNSGGTAPEWGAGSAFTEFYESAEQAITAAGTLTLAHGLSSTPKMFEVLLVCVTNELSYTTGMEVVVNPNSNDNGSDGGYGISIVPDSSNLNIRYGSGTGVFVLMNYVSGNSQMITPANWRMKVRAWA